MIPHSPDEAASEPGVGPGRLLLPCRRTHTARGRAGMMPIAYARRKDPSTPQALHPGWLQSPQ
jgi:hypothetical protein